MAVGSRKFFGIFLDFDLEDMKDTLDCGQGKKVQVQTLEVFPGCTENLLGKAHSSFFPHVEVVIHALYECHKNIWKSIWLINLWVIIQAKY